VLNACTGAGLDDHLIVDWWSTLSSTIGLYDAFPRQDGTWSMGLYEPYHSGYDKIATCLLSSAKLFSRDEAL
jgi:hypothetical protein